MMKIKYMITSLIMATSFNAGAAIRMGRFFDRAIIVVFENENYSSAIQQPFFRQLADTGAHFTQFYALTHPSQGNYIALTSGDLNGITNDQPKTINVPSIVDLLEAKGLTWKVYAENFPGKCFIGKSSGTYYRKHNPFISYASIQSNPARCAKIVDAGQFDKDAAAGLLPNYVFYIPDANNDGHDTSVGFADKWYKNKFGPYVANPRFMENTILVSTFDESDMTSTTNQIYTTIVGPMVHAGAYTDQLTIPSLLKLIEDNWSLGNLGKKDVSSKPVPNIWK